MTWSAVAAGTYSLTAVATDNDGASTTSAAVSVRVDPSANQPPSVTSDGTRERRLVYRAGQHFLGGNGI